VFQLDNSCPLIAALFPFSLFLLVRFIRFTQWIWYARCPVA
jgi:hypothetical protein